MEQARYWVRFGAGGPMTLPDSTSQWFLIPGQLGRGQTEDIYRVIIVQLDFAGTGQRECEEKDFEKWYARIFKTEGLMGHMQGYKRQEPDTECYVGEEYFDPVGLEDQCRWADEHDECDYNFVHNGKKYMPVGPEAIPAGVWTGNPDQTYRGS